MHAGYNMYVLYRALVPCVIHYLYIVTAVNNVGLGYEHPEFLNEYPAEVSCTCAPTVISEVTFGCYMYMYLLTLQRFYKMIEINCQSMVQVKCLSLSLSSLSLPSPSLLLLPPSPLPPHA